MTSIRGRLTVQLFCAVGLLQAAGLLVLYVVASRASMSEFDDALRAKALAVSSLIAWSPGGVRTDLADFYLGVSEAKGLQRRLSVTGAESFRRFLEGFRHRGRHSYFELWDRDGRVLGRSESLRGADLPRRMGAANESPIWEFSEPNGEPGRAVGFLFQPETNGSMAASAKPPGQIQVVVATEREALDEDLGRLRLLVVCCGILLLGTTIWLVPRMLRHGLAPLRKLGEDVSAIDAERLTSRLELAGTPEELHPIIGRLNELLGRLEGSFERERRFTADVAHELRTPLAELRALADYAIKWPRHGDVSTLQEIREVARQMQTIFDRMLALARGEQQLPHLKPERLRLDAVVGGLWRGFAARAESRGLSVALDLRGAECETDELLLKATLTIAIDNAVDYSPPGSTIRIACGAQDGTVAVRVSNPAPELETADLPKLFDRFWRKEVARSGGGRHLGIGLSLARIYAQALGWQLTAELGGDGELSLVFTGRTQASGISAPPVSTGTSRASV